MSDASYDDSKWKETDSSQSFSSIRFSEFKGIVWFRLHLITDSTVSARPLALMMHHIGASEIYFDGKLIKSFGKINGYDSSVYYDPQELPFTFVIPSAGKHVFAVRYANFEALRNKNAFGNAWAGFTMSIGETEQLIDHEHLRSVVVTFIIMFICGIFLALSMLHLFMYLYYRSTRSNLFFSIFMFCLAALFFTSFISFFSHSPRTQLINLLFVNPLICVASISLSGFINELFHHKKGIRFYLMIAFSVVTMIMKIFEIQLFATATVLLILYVALEAVIMIIAAMFKNVKGARIIGAGILLFAFFLLTIFFLAVFKNGKSLDINDSTVEGQILLVCFGLSILSIPFSMSVYQAWSFARVNKDLAMQVDQIKILSQKSIEQEQEKQRMLENTKEELEKEVQLRTAELRETHQQLIQQEKLASLGQLTAGIAHEIKNPLNFVTNFSDLSVELIDEIGSSESDLEKKELLEMLKNNLQKINHHGKRADSIVRNMLEHSRSGQGEKRLTDVNQLCEEFFDLAYHGMRATIPEFNCDLKKELTPDLPEIRMVPQDISRVFLNLFNNAFYAVNKKTRERGIKNSEKEYQPKVTLVTAMQSNHLIIRIRDNGTGIPDSVKEKIFNPFFTTKPTGEGTGLGLSLSYDIIKTHGGEIRVESKEGEGTEFVISLPC